MFPESYSQKSNIQKIYLKFDETMTPRHLDLGSKLIKETNGTIRYRKLYTYMYRTENLQLKLIINSLLIKGPIHDLRPKFYFLMFII